MSLLKVAHITTVDVSLRYLLVNQLRSIQAAGYEVVGISSSGPDVPSIEAAGIRHIPVHIARTVSPAADIISLWNLYRVLRREHFTIVHTHNPKPGLLGQLAASLAGVPVIVNTLHGYYFHDDMHPSIQQLFILEEKLAAACSDVILSQSSEDIDTALREHICPPQRIKHLGNGIDLSVFDPNRVSELERLHTREALGLPLSAPIVGFVGRLAGKRKGLFDLLAAGQQVQAAIPDVRFLLVGAPDRGKRDAVGPEIAGSYGLAAACIFAGPRPNAELSGLYSIMDVLVLPSLFEGMPRAVMEAAAMGVPAVVTDVKGNREVVEHGCNGLCVPLGDVPSLARAIVEVLQDPHKAARMGAAGRRMALQRFDERMVFAKVIAEYARLLREKGLPVPAKGHDR